ncbi:unnamed protein product [Meganyctiphanes norvegica]|uniref:Uncharacterized protein n=1 Tax=Meganyctiphanes norvegica TaxID=48144 RepID=A0AAV2PYL5_MEGNR
MTRGILCPVWQVKIDKSSPLTRLYSGGSTPLLYVNPKVYIPLILLKNRHRKHLRGRTPCRPLLVGITPCHDNGNKYTRKNHKKKYIYTGSEKQAEKLEVCCTLKYMTMSP